MLLAILFILSFLNFTLMFANIIRANKEFNQNEYNAAMWSCVVTSLQLMGGIVPLMRAYSILHP